MAQVKVVVDSTADLPPDVMRQLNVGMVPLNVHFGDDTYLDRVELEPDEFFARLGSSRQLPSTSAPSVEAFRRKFEEALPEASGIVCITVGSKLSATHNVASLAAQQFHQLPVRVVDSRSASMGVGFAAMAAAEAAAGGATVDEVEAVARAVVNRTGIAFFADTLEYLQRNGRIGRAAGLLGALLQVKPVLTIEDGVVTPYARTRTTRKAIQSLVDWARGLGSVERMATIWSTDESQLDQLLSALGDSYDRESILVTKYGPVIGSHLGPGALGVIAVSGSGGA